MRKKGKRKMEEEDAHDSGCFVLQLCQQETEPLLSGHDWTVHFQPTQDSIAALQLFRDQTGTETRFHSDQL